MNLLLAENPNYTIEPFMERLNTVPNSSRMTINPRNYFECIQLLKNQPVLTKKWLCDINPRLSISQMKSILEKDNLNIIRVENKAKFEELSQTLLEEGVKFKTFNNLQPPKEKIIEYVHKSLNLDYETSKYLCNRHKFYLPKVMESVSILENVENVDKKAIQNYTVRYNSVYLSSITDKLLGLEKVSNKKIIECIHRFRYGFDFILKSIKKDLEIYEYVFTEISFGSLTLENYLDFHGEHKGYNALPDFRKLKIIQAYEKLSYDKLYFIKLKVEEIDSNSSNIYKLIRLLGGK